MGQAIATRNHMPDRMTYARLGKTGFLVSRVSLGGYANHGQKANAGTTASADPDAYRAALQYLIDVLLLHHLTTLSDSPYHNLGYVGPNYDHSINHLTTKEHRHER